MRPGRAWGLWLEPDESAELPGHEFGEFVNRRIDYDVVVVHLMPEYFPGWRRREPGRRVVGYTAWEFEATLPDWSGTFDGLDALMVPCRWNRSTLEAAGVRCPVTVVPHVPERPSFAEEEPLVVDGVRPDDFVFYTVSAWSERKAPHLSLEAFLAAFREDDPAVFVIKTSNLNERRRRPGRLWRWALRHVETTRREIAAIRRRSGSSARVVVLTARLTDRQVRALHRLGDCFVSLTRSEGWGLGAFEAALAGNAVVITGHGGQLDYLPGSLAHLVPFRLVEAGGDAPGARWAEPDVQEAAAVLRALAASPDDARRRGAALREHVQERFRAEDSTAAMLAVLAGEGR
jgi:glycosyltransferase involved in cell wall biosynthesis